MKLEIAGQGGIFNRLKNVVGRELMSCAVVKSLGRLRAVPMSCLLFAVMWALGGGSVYSSCQEEFSNIGLLESCNVRGAMG